MNLSMELTLFSEPVDIDYDKHERYIKRWFKLFGNSIMWPAWNQNENLYNGVWDYHTVHVETLIDIYAIWALEIIQIEFLLNGTFALSEFDRGPIRVCHAMQGKVASKLWDVPETFRNVPPLKGYQYVFTSGEQSF